LPLLLYTFRQPASPSWSGLGIGIAHLVASSALLGALHADLATRLALMVQAFLGTVAVKL